LNNGRGPTTALIRRASPGGEQVMIQAREPRKNGCDLLNQINSIAKANPDYERLTAMGRKIIGKDKP
jgi:hypothetical protein